jgi:uncharacterized phage-associated protein
MMGPFDSRAIANRILDIADRKSKPLTLMQLLKLVYLAHGWWLTFSNGKPLTDTEPQAWQYGPVHPQVYRAFRHYGRSPISGRAINSVTGRPYDAEFGGDVDQLLEQVVDSYGSYHAFSLSDMMHRPGTPWTITNSQHGDYAPIPSDLIKKHFDDIRAGRAA